MPLRIQQLDLRVLSDDGEYGASLRFKLGLNIIRAENTSGKTTVMQSIIYALGLEDCLGPQRTTPLSPALTRELIGTNGSITKIISSSVALEITNTTGRTARVVRSIVGDASRKLISVFEAGAQHDYYIGYEGSASRERGFHVWLADFIGWELPQVHRFAGGEVPLYASALAGAFYVEQKRGWSGLLANLPTFYGIRDLYSRVIEYLLALDVYEVDSKKQSLAEQIKRQKSEWRSVVIQFRRHCYQMQMQLDKVPDELALDWRENSIPRLVCIDGEKWITVEEKINLLHVELREKQKAPEIPKQVTSIGEIDEIEKEGRRLETLEFEGRDLQESYELLKSQFDSVQNRLDALKEDREKYKDAIRLHDLGSVEHLRFVEGRCPTCEQTITEAQTVYKNSPVMSLGDNLTYIEKQIGAFQNYSDGLRNELLEKDALMRSKRDEIYRSIDLIRTRREALAQPKSGIDVVEVKRQFWLEQEINRLTRAYEEFREFVAALDELTGECTRSSQELAKLPKDGLTSSDKNKLEILRKTVCEQLASYQFKSFDPTKMSISNLNYRPQLEGYDIASEASASDNIRLIWSYYLALMEVGREAQTHHPGVVLFDEPKQQDAKVDSYEQLLERAANSLEFGQQVIVATSEPAETLNKFVKDNDIGSYYELPARIINRISGSPSS